MTQLAVSMSTVFGKDPPLFTKRPQPTESAAPTPQRQASSSTLLQLQNAQRLKEAQLEKEASEANKALEVARKAEERDTRIKTDLVSKLTAKLQSNLTSHLTRERREILSALEDQQRLELASQTIIPSQLEHLNSVKDKLEEETTKVDEATEKLKNLLDQGNPASTSGGADKSTVDDRCVPQSPVMAQMLDLSAENASITDALYFLDKALAQSTIPLDVHQKTVRKLAKRQFMVRAAFDQDTATPGKGKPVFSGTACMAKVRLLKTLKLVDMSCLKWKHFNNYFVSA
eukprot:CAMPEP_0118705868 /NCGR_PEP_ID=MMETSP0800-20121206/20164_1 /TAXON_ID=210618 ORGANISM="Striatella unipunctata, Strain CCMP2910" /NCGR_SAMPLE_ID=MMETSP0800 /ASSEMBLY_ACC=CAM_ASM_000638 /LENGTH=286 /DNA_ID=CAMNT_0006608185 /DNA_START=340 /DNA_END=1195 /DNA_ORIENTATION=-